MELEALLSHDLLAVNELEMSHKIYKKAMFTGDFHDITLSKDTISSLEPCNIEVLLIITEERNSYVVIHMQT